MTLEVKHRKAAHVAESINVNGELPEEVNDRGRAPRQRETEDEWRDNYGQ